MSDKQIIIALVLVSAIVLGVAGYIYLPAPTAAADPPAQPVRKRPPATPPESTDAPTALPSEASAPATAPVVVPPPPLPEPQRLEAALAALKVHATWHGWSEAALAKREQQLGKPIPTPVRRLLASVSPGSWKKFVNSIRLESLGDCKFMATPYGDITEGAPGIYGLGPCFIFAAGEYGDGIVVDKTGRVILADHEGPMVVLADSLSAWLERLIANDGVEYAYLGGQIWDLPPDRRRVFLEDHRRLNPDKEWAARLLMALDPPGSHAPGRHVWDEEGRRLIPIADAPSVPHLTIEYVTQADMADVLKAKECVNLTLIGGKTTELDLTPLTGAKTLTDLYVYDIPEVDAGQLAAHPSLNEICFLRCHVKNVAALADLPTLKRLRLEYCTADTADVERFRAKRPDVAME